MPQQDAGPNDEERGQPHVPMRASSARSSSSVSFALGLLVPVNAIFSNKSARLAATVVGVVGVVAAVVLVRYFRHRHDQRMTSSCANHAIQLRFLIIQFVEKADRFPSESDTRSALAKMSPKDQWPAGWLSSYGSSCAESYLRDGSIGYVFVADGLPTKVAVEDSALVLFCPAGSHQRSEQHCHAVVVNGELLCLESNLEMIELLRREIGRAKEGKIPYSTNAVTKMERELKAREEHAREQQPNKPAAGNAGIASQLTIGHHRPGVPEPER